MTSTFARSSASTKMSRPNIDGPTSVLAGAVDLARVAAFLVFAMAVVVVFILLIRSFGFPASRSQVTKNPRPFPAVGSCRNCCLPSTSANGVGNYDDQQVYLNKGANHGADFKPEGPHGSSADSRSPRSSVGKLRAQVSRGEPAAGATRVSCSSQSVPPIMVKSTSCGRLTCLTG